MSVAFTTAQISSPEPSPSDAGGGDFLADDLVEAEVVTATTAVLLGNRHPGESELAGPGEDFSGNDAVAFPVEKVRADFLGDKRRK